MKPWSKLQKQLYLLIDPSIDFQIHCNAYRMKSQRGTTSLPRYWIVLNKEIIFDYPKDFLSNLIPREGSRELRTTGTSTWLLNSDLTVKDLYPYYTEVQDISCVIREYIDTPVNELFGKTFENDKWGLTDILKAADKRLGKNKLIQIKQETSSSNVLKVIIARGI